MVVLSNSKLHSFVAKIDAPSVPNIWRGSVSLLWSHLSPHAFLLLAPGWSLSLVGSSVLRHYAVFPSSGL